MKKGMISLITVIMIVVVAGAGYFALKETKLADMLPAGLQVGNEFGEEVAEIPPVDYTDASDDWCFWVVPYNEDGEVMVKDDWNLNWVTEPAQLKAFVRMSNDADTDRYALFRLASGSIGGEMIKQQMLGRQNAYMPGIKHEDTIQLAPGESLVLESDYFPADIVKTMPETHTVSVTYWYDDDWGVVKDVRFFERNVCKMETVGGIHEGINILAFPAGSQVGVDEVVEWQATGYV